MTRKTKKPLLRAALLAVALLLALTACGQPATEPSSSTSESAGGLGETAVKAIALAHAQLAEDQTQELKTARRMENGLLQYDVSFTSGGVRYLYVIDGASGAILSNQTDTPSPSSATGQGDIGETAAKAVALAHAGFREEEVTGLRVRQDYDDGRLEYDVDFWKGSDEYDYTVDGAAGTVIAYEKETHPQGSSSAPAPSAGDIGAEAAKAAALAHAGIQEKDATGMKIDREYDNGRLEYDIDFWQGSTEYQYTVDAATGEVREYEKEGHGAGGAGGTGDIGVEGAKAAALAHAGLKEKDVTGLTVDRDYDNGRLEYDVDFWQGSSEHEYTIDGVTGEVLEYEGERHGAGHGGGTGDIGAEGAKAAALAHAGLKEKDVTGLTVDRDYDDGRLEYDVDFWQGSTEYEYTIDGATGAVLECQQDRH